MADTASLSLYGMQEKRTLNGGVAQLGEHLPCKQGVMGSNPIISTNGSDQGASSAATESHHPSSIGKSATK